MELDQNPLPRLTVNIGISGHRRLKPDAELQLRHDISAFFQTIKDEVQHLLEGDSLQQARELYSAEPPRFVLLSALASGADSIAAEEAMKLGYELHAPLPMAREEYAKDFDTPETLATFHRLLSEATRIFEISAANPERGHSYADAARVVLNHSDVLLALWDGRDTEFIAGTAATIDQATNLHIPVIHIHSEGTSPTCIMTDGFRATDWKEKLRAHFKSLLLPVEAASIKGDVRFTQACAHQRPISGKAWGKHLLFFPGLFVRTERFFRNLLRWLPPHPKRPQMVPPIADNDVFEKHNPQFLQACSRFFRWFDTCSNAYSVRYRSGLVWRYWAPVLAIAALGLADNWGGLFGGSPWSIKAWMTAAFVIQGFFLALPVILQLFDKWKMWHRKFFSYRVVGEQLRQSQYLGSIGYVMVRPKESTYKNSPQRWTAWYYRALMRHMGLPHATVDRHYLTDWMVWTRDQFVVDQMNYHHSRFLGEGNLSRKLINMGMVIFLLGTLAAICKSCLTVGETKLVYVSLLALWLPSLAVFCAGFCSYAGYPKNQQVSSEGYNNLKAICDEMDQLIRSEQVDNAPPPTDPAMLPKPLHFSHAYNLAAHIHDCCKDELMGWEDLISSKGIKT